MRYPNHFFLMLFSLILLTNPLRAAESSTSTETVTSATPRNFGLELSYGAVAFGKYRYQSGGFVDSFAHSAMLEIEWLLTEKAGKLGLGGGTAGIFGAGGSSESLSVIPVHASLSYHLDYVDRQIFVPFIRAGISAVWSKENGGPSQFFNGFEATAGAQICLSNMDKEASRNLDRDIGINDTYLLLQYSRSFALSDASGADLSHEAFGVGLRFEI